MEIIITTSELSKKIRDTFLEESASIPENAANAKSSGLLDEREFESAVLYADSFLRSRIVRFLCNPNIPARNISGSDNIKYNVVGTSRRLSGRQQILHDLFLEFLAEMSLANIFKPLVAEAAQAHATTGADILTTITSTLFEKKPPYPSSCSR